MPRSLEMSRNAVPEQLQSGDDEQSVADAVDLASDRRAMAKLYPGVTDNHVWGLWRSQPWTNWYALGPQRLSRLVADDRRAATGAAVRPQEGRPVLRNNGAP